MSEEEKQASVNAGSAEVNTQGPSTEGEPNKESSNDQGAENVLKEQYEELEKKIGSQGQELGEYREFLRGIEPLLDKLQGKDDLIQAIVDGKITSELAQAVADGKVNIEDATTVAKAHEEVKKDLGVKKYENASPEKIEELVAERVRAEVESVKKTFKTDISNLEERRDFETTVQKFIDSTSDFPEYSEDITKWLDEHPNIYDIETAYFAVKGRKAAKASKDSSEEASIEEAKRIASNAGGGQSQGGAMPSGDSVVDDLIAPRTNPNYL